MGGFFIGVYWGASSGQGSKVVHLWTVMSGVSNSRTWPFNNLLSVTQWGPVRASKMAPWEEVKTLKAHPRVILEASFARRAIAATARRQPGQPCATESNLLHKYPLGAEWGLMLG